MNDLIDLQPLKFENDFFKWLEKRKILEGYRLETVTGLRIEEGLEDIDDVSDNFYVDGHDSIRGSKFYELVRDIGVRKYLLCIFKVYGQRVTAKVYGDGKITLSRVGSKLSDEELRDSFRFVYQDLTRLHKEWKGKTK